MNQKGFDIRSFIAVDLPDSVKEPLQDLQSKLIKYKINASFPKPETLHLTLKFLGNVQPADLEMIKKSMEKATAGILPHSLFASGIGVFPSVKNTRIIWSGIRGETDILKRLAGGLESELFKHAGIKREEKRFSPHLTLARIKTGISPGIIIRMIKDFENFRTPDFPVSGISLFQSELLSSGAIHKLIAFIPFLY